ncbi:hypothetical protein COTS27_00428 [Spirochaetota bacterium]|nr:hypothetical protein COTS27_00428 [Spirochaetota bacterium]
MKKILKNPLTIAASVAIGIYIGINFKEVAKTIAPFGNMYLYLLQMSVIPILISAIVSSIAKLIKSKGINKLLVKMLFYFVLSVTFCGMLGTFAGVWNKPGELINNQTREVLSQIVESSEETTDLEVSISQPYKEVPRKRILDFVASIIPSNIFESLASGRAMELVFFSIILGIAIGFTEDKSGETLSNIFVTLFLAFQKIINWAMYVLPFGLICLIADQVADTGLNVIFAMFNLIILFYGIGLLMMIINCIVIYVRSRKSIKQVLYAVLTPIIIAFSTRSSFATIPSCVEALEKKLFFERSVTNLLIPLGITLGRYGNIIYFSLVSIFLLQLYGIDYGSVDIIKTIIGSILAGIATAGATGLATLAAIQIVLTPLGLPFEVIIVILLAIDTIIDPLRTALIVQTNLAYTALVAQRFKGKRRPIITKDLIHPSATDANAVENIETPAVAEHKN